MKYFDNLPSIEKIWGKGNPDYDGTLSIVVVGASGNLAMLKVSEY
jgi:glucose-6-phosphate dehydrogenase